MKYVCVDIGSYSIKFIQASIEKKKATSELLTEIVIKEFLENYRGEINEDKVQFEIIQHYLNEHLLEARIISQVPNNLVSSRFFTIPIKNKKKARMAIPFQLEEEIPYSVQNVHMSPIIQTIGEHTLAFVAFVNKNSFDKYFQSLIDANIIPDILTSEASAFQSYVKHHKINNPVCILDLGHSTSKAYFFNSGNLVSSHVSYLGGSAVTDVISKTYNITIEEAEIYKHQNAFLLTNEQYQEVQENQRHFADLMKKTFEPLIADIKRWEIGFRVKYGVKMQNILITGGTSNFTNITNFLTENIGVRAQRLKSFEGIETLTSDVDPKIENKFSVASLMALNMLNKNALINFRTGASYSGGSNNDLPLHSLMFIGMRIALVCSILLLGLFIERFFLSADISALDARITNIIKNPSMNISNRLQRQFKRKNGVATTKDIYSKILKKNKSINQEIKAIKDASKINAVSPLIDLSKLLKLTPNIYIKEFKSQDSFVSCTFRTQKYDELKTLEEQIKSFDFKDLNLKYSNTKEMLTVTFRE